MTVVEADAALHAASTPVPASQGAAAQARWWFQAPDAKWMVWATIGTDGKVTDKGAVKAGANP